MVLLSDAPTGRCLLLCLLGACSSSGQAFLRVHLLCILITHNKAHVDLVGSTNLDNDMPASKQRDCLRLEAIVLQQQRSILEAVQNPQRHSGQPYMLTQQAEVLAWPADAGWPWKGPGWGRQLLR